MTLENKPAIILTITTENTMIGFLYVLKSGFVKDIYVVTDIEYRHVKYYTLVNTVTQKIIVIDVHEFMNIFKLYT